MFGTGAMTRTDGWGGLVLDGVETAVAAARVSVSSATRSAFDRGLAQTSLSPPPPPPLIFVARLVLEALRAPSLPFHQPAPPGRCHGAQDLSPCHASSPPFRADRPVSAALRGGAACAVLEVRPSWKTTSRIPPRLSLAALVAAALLATVALAPPAAQAQTQTEVWSATLTVRLLTSTIRGCDNGVASGLCSSTSNLTDDDFTHASTDYEIVGLFVRSDGTLDFHVDTDYAMGSENLILDVAGTEFAFEDADVEGDTLSLNPPMGRAHRTWGYGGNAS